MKPIFSRDSYPVRIIALMLLIFLLAGCADGKRINSDGIEYPDGFSGGEQAAIGVGAAIAAIAIGKLIYDAVNEDELAEAKNDWAGKGPALTAAYTLSNLNIGGYVRGGWPIAVDYQMRRPGHIILRIETEDGNPYRISMDGATLNRKLQMFRLPRGLGSEPKFAKIQVVAADGEDNEGDPVPVNIYGIACGPNAVGSIGIDQINFGPNRVRLSLQQEASYDFRRHKSFDKVSAAFRKVEDKNGVIGIGDIVKEEPISVAPLNEEDKSQMIIGPLAWNGKTGNNKPSEGVHVLQLRAWYADENKRDWGVALSPDWVEIKQ